MDRDPGSLLNGKRAILTASPVKSTIGLAVEFATGITGETGLFQGIVTTGF
jgi:hypothetical protein